MHVCFSGHAVSGRVASDGHELRRRVRHHQQQLIATRSSTDEPTHYHYWPDGTRAAVLHPDHTATYTFGSIEATRDLATNTWVTATRLYSHAATTVAARTNNQPLDWLLGDRQGSITTTITAGAATTRYYHPYGQPRGDIPPTTPTRRSWLNQPTDPTGLTYLTNRYHDPTLAVFTSIDPLLTTTWQPYTYASSNPTSYSDPTGLAPGISQVADGNRDHRTKDAWDAHRALLKFLYYPDAKAGELSADTSTASHPITPVPGVGTVRINLFIPPAEVCIAGYCVEGDNRSFSPTAGIRESRATLVADFDSGILTASYNYSCSRTSCRSASPVTIFDWSDIPAGMVLGDAPGGNNVSFAQSSTQLTLRIEGRISVGPPLVPSPSINSTLELTVNPAGTVRANRQGNGFPAYEIYQDRGHGPVLVKTFRAGSPMALIDGPVGGAARLLDWIF